MLKKNLLSNFGARIWGVLVAFFVLPYNIHYLGVEAYGLIGFYTTLLCLSSVFDLGLSTVTSREIARYSASSQESAEICNFSRTLEVIYWGMGLLLTLAIWMMTPFISKHWLTPERLSFSTIQTSLMGMGCALGLVWPFSFYSGLLFGLEKQVPLNIILIIVSTLRGLGTMVVLAYISPTIEAYFIWQSLISFVQLVLSAVYCRRYISIKSGRFEIRTLKKIWRFTAGLSLITITATVLSQFDKLILSRFIDLKAFGYYAIAANIGGALFHINSPVFFTFLPRFTHFFTQGHQESLKDSYHLASQVVSTLLFPTAALLFIFPLEILTIWGIEAEAIPKVIPLLRLLVIGTTLHALLSLSTALQFAVGWVRLSLIQNVLAILIVLPLTVWAVITFGAKGAAWMWIVMHLTFLLITIPLMHRKYLIGELKKWYLDDCFYPLFGALSVTLLGYLVFPRHLDKWGNFAYLTLLFFLAVLASSLLASLIRERLLTRSLFQSKSNE